MVYVCVALELPRTSKKGMEIKAIVQQLTELKKSLQQVSLRGHNTILLHKCNGRLQLNSGKIVSVASIRKVLNKSFA